MITKKILIGFSLILILLILCIYYNSYHETNLKYRSTGAILSNYPEGSAVSVSGTVISLNNDGFNLLDDNNGKKAIYKIESSKQVESGDKVQLIGILGPSYTIKSTKIIVEKSWSYEFVLIRSAFALIFLIFIFLRYWKFDFKTFEFARLKENRAYKREAFVACKILRILRFRK